MKVAQYYTALAIFSLALISIVSSSPVDNRVKQLETIALSAVSLKSGLGEVDVKLNRLDQQIQDIQPSCCEKQVITEPINDQFKSIDVDSLFSKVVPLKYQNYVATGYFNGVKIYDLRTKKLVRSLDNSFVGDLKKFKENQLIQASATGLIKIWDLEKGELQQTLSAHSGEGVYSIALNKNQSLMLSAGWDANIILWDMIEFKQIRTFTGHSKSIRSVIFNEAKNQVISASDDQTIRIWNIHDASLVRTLYGHYRSVNKLLLDEETGVLYSASDDRTIKKWDIESGRSLATFIGHLDFVYDIILSEDKQNLVSSSLDSSVIIWDNHSNSKIDQLKFSDAIYNLALNPLNGQLLSTSGNQKLLFWPFKP